MVAIESNSATLIKALHKAEKFKLPREKKCN
jgi:hypothetical protein